MSARLALVLAACAVLAPGRSAQEPPLPVPADEPVPEGGETETEQEAPPPVPAAEETVESAPAASEVAAVAAPAHPAVVWPLSIEAIEMHLRGIAELHPELASLDVLGRSAGGREILALRLTAGGKGGPDKPVLLLVDHQGAASAGAEALLELAWKLVSSGDDARLRSSLEHAALVLAPALDPDVRAGNGSLRPGAPPATLFERNFPSGWQPDSVRPGSGRVTLSKPETLAAARYLGNLKGCAVVLGFAPPAPRGAPYPGAELPPQDREVFGKLGAALELPGASALVPWFELGSCGGGLFDYAYQARGIYPLVFTLPAEDELAAGGLSAFAEQVATRVLRCLTLLPRVEIALEGLERLASDTWQVDVRIQNAGIVPTASALARPREAFADVALRLDGAKLVATARRPASGADFTDPSFQVRTPLSGGTLAGGEGRWLRLFLEASSGVEVRVTAASLWAGSAAVQVALP